MPDGSGLRTIDIAFCSEIRLRRVDGELFDAEVSSVLILDEGAETTSLMTVRDLRKMANADLKEAVAKLAPNASMPVQKALPASAKA